MGYLKPRVWKKPWDSSVVETDMFLCCAGASLAVSTAQRPERGKGTHLHTLAHWVAPNTSSGGTESWRKSAAVQDRLSPPPLLSGPPLSLSVFSADDRCVWGQSQETQVCLEGEISYYQVAQCRCQQSKGQHRGRVSTVTTSPC